MARLKKDTAKHNFITLRISLDEKNEFQRNCKIRNTTPTQQFLSCIRKFNEETAEVQKAQPDLFQDDQNN